MSQFNGLLRNGDIREKLSSLALRFAPFSFPDCLEIITDEERSYREAVTDLWAMDCNTLEKIEEETWQEWTLGIDMGQEMESSRYYLLEFTKRVNDALNDSYALLGDAFNGSQTPMSDIQPIETWSAPQSSTPMTSSGRTFAKIDSFSTLIESPPPSPDYPEEFDADYPPEYSMEAVPPEFSPSSSMTQLGIQNPS